MFRNHKERVGNAHVATVIILFAALLGFVGFVFWQNFLREKDSAPTNTNEVWKTYHSITGSGLSFEYPSSWYIDTNAAEHDFGDGRKSLVHPLTSAKLQNDGKGITDGHSEEYMCVTLNELSGPWPYSYKPIDDNVTTEDFLSGGTTLSLLTSQDTGIMQVISKNPVGEHGTSYLPLRNEHFVLVTAQYSCFGSGAPANFKDRPEYIQAKRILKSIKLNDT